MAPSSPTLQGPQPGRSIPPYFAKLKDPCRRRRRLHHLQDLIVSARCAIIAGAQDGQEIETFGRKRRDWRRRFLRLPNGIPSHDTFERVFDRLQPQAFQACFRQWAQAVSAALRIKHVAIDGKTWRGSGSAKLGPLHLVSAGAPAQHRSLGQVAVAAQSHEITALPALLELLDVKGALVTIDARGCPKAMARPMVDQGGDYALIVKENQEHLGADIRRRFEQAFATDFAGLACDIYEKRERGHGREELRRYTVLHTTAGIRHADDWAGLTTIGMCYSERTVHGKTSLELRYFIGSKQAGAKYYGSGLRQHGGIENHLHGPLDVTCGEDKNRVSQRNAAENLALLRRLTLTLVQAHPAPLRIAKKRFAAALDPDLLEEILRGDGILEKP